MSMSGSYARKSVSNFIIKLYAKLYRIVIETNLICDVIIINNKKRHNSFTIFTTRRVLHTEPYFLQNIFILSVWPLRGHLAARGVISTGDNRWYIKTGNGISLYRRGTTHNG